MVIVLDCESVVSELEPHSRYYIDLRANTLGKGMDPTLSSKLWVE